MKEIIVPNKLRVGDKVALISPATTVKPEYIDGAVAWLRSVGLDPVVMPHAAGPKSGSYASSEQDRLDDWLAALSDPSIKAIFCTRGGYGCVHLAAKTPIEIVRQNPKWLVGFSDVSALHALMNRAGVASIHGPMAKHLSGYEPDELDCGVNPLESVKQLLFTGLPINYELRTFSGNHFGEAAGILLGGNMQVLNNLAGTDFDLFAKALDQDVILFMEDIHEPIYAVERMLMRLWLSGILKAAKGLIFGRFTDYKADANYPDMNAMIIDFLRKHDVGPKPIAINFPIGHLANNLPLVESVRATLEIDPATTSIMF